MNNISWPRYKTKKKCKTKSTEIPTILPRLKSPVIQKKNSQEMVYLYRSTRPYSVIKAYMGVHESEMKHTPPACHSAFRGYSLMGEYFLFLHGHM